MTSEKHYDELSVLNDLKTKTDLSDRINGLKKSIMIRKGSFIHEMINPFCRDIALWRAFKVAGRSRVQRRAAYLKELVALAPIEIFPDWSLAGEHLPTAGNSFGFLRDDLDKIQDRIFEFGIESEEVEQVRFAVEDWNGRLGNNNSHEYFEVGECCDEETLKGASNGDSGSESVFTVWGSLENHSVRGYHKVLNIGFSGLKENVESELKSLEKTDPTRPEKENFLYAALLICEAGETLGRRYAEKAMQLAGETDDILQKERLMKMSEACGQVPARGARTLFEATQSLWLAHILTCGEDGINANSIGRMDQMLNPFYEADLKNGVISRCQAVELMEEFACKMYLEYDVQAITLGGVDSSGNDAVNEMSYIILEATENVGLIRDVSVRLNLKSPDRFIGKCAELITHGGGIPFIFNDDCFIKAMNDRGIALEDARDYAPIGCVEITIPGKANPRAVSGWFNSLKCMELTLFGGMDPKSGKQIGPRTPPLTEMTSFDELYKNYIVQMNFFTGNIVYNCNVQEIKQREKGPLPCLSVLTDDCITRGRDITNGGAVYDYHSICFVGAADTADSLYAVKKMVFEEKKISASDLLKALKSNFEGHEVLRRALLGVPKYGNDIYDVDVLAKRICDDFVDYLDKHESCCGGKFFAQLFSFVLNLGFGSSTGATPDGRYAGEPVAYSLSAHQGRDEEGITSMLKSLSRMPHNRAAAASAAIVDLTPKLVEGRAGLDRMKYIIRSSLALGVGQVQFNVVTAERLKLAKENPDEYGNIPVRVAGYSQMFKLVPDDLQDHIIARTKHFE